VVEVVGVEEPVISCTTPVADGMKVSTKSARLAAARRQAMEKILEGHPADCSTCVKYLNCELQALKQYVSEEEYRPKGPARLFAVDDANPLFTIDPNKCVMCTRCVRACQELRGVGILVEKTKDDERYIGTVEGKSLAASDCRFCGACAEVCPSGAIMDKRSLTEGKNRKTALLPCRYSCPAEIDVPAYLRFIGEKDYAAAAAVIREKVPFPGVLGYVCDRPCEDVCRRGAINQAISIRELKRFAAEQDETSSGKRESATSKKVAVIGSGPAGLTAAYYLAKRGHEVAVHEGMPEAGGMLRYGIPAYRLPRKVLKKEIKYIEDAGVTIKTGTRVASIDELFQQGFNGVIVAVGTHRGQKLNIPGADNPGVLIGVDFLKDVNSGKKVNIGKDVLVLGGGNVAFDCARAALRLGVAQVKIACLESRETMPAAKEEIEQGEEEGIKLYPGRTFTEILAENRRITGVACLEVTSLSFDEGKNPQIAAKENSEHIIAADTVIFAIGQRPEIPEGFGLETDAGNCIKVDEFTFATSQEGVFAAGDAVNGTSSVIKAIASGRKAAVALDRYLGGSGDVDEKLAPEVEIKKAIGLCEGFASLERCRDTYAPAGERTKSFGRVIEDMDAAAAESEAKRCLQCDLRLKMTSIKFWSQY
jgi:NADPH-dependent glutamate synthase beta subunit-like oxidoreductase/Pyruvate/2-oxoacid:ferredoxin oxidoreductase delta subunit